MGWYPIECEHGYDCCPKCDGARRDPQTLKIVPPSRERLTLDATSIGMTLKQKPTPPKTPRFVKPIALK